MTKRIVFLFLISLIVLGGCVSAERQEEYAAWKRSDDFVYNVSLTDFELKYKEGWRKRAETKKAERIALEEISRRERERIEAERKKREHEELVTRIDRVYCDFVEEVWTKEAQDSYRRALQGAFADLSDFIYVASPDGVNMIESFAAEKMPNAASAYEKAKEHAAELQEVYNEEFSSPVNNSSDKYAVYCKVLERLANARAKYHRAYKELAHYYIQHKFGVLSQEELSIIDAQPTAVYFMKINSIPRWPEHKTLAGNESEFAAKFMPESYALYQLFLKEYDEAGRLYSELQVEQEKVNGFVEKVFELAHNKGRGLADNINKLTSEYNDLYMQHRIGDKDAEALSRIDRDRANGLKSFVESLSQRYLYATKEQKEAFIKGCEQEKLHDAVQLWDNGPLWAKCNVGAHSSEECGDYFEWGNEQSLTWLYREKLYRRASECPTRFKDGSQLRAEGYIDGSENLVPAHDAARRNLRSPWRMPTRHELRGLVRNCDSELTTRNGVRGRLFKGRGVFASKSIFLPLAGYGYNDYPYDYEVKKRGIQSLGKCGYYWSSSLEYDHPVTLDLNDNEVCNSRYPEYGRSVRPVVDFVR